MALISTVFLLIGDCETLENHGFIYLSVFVFNLIVHDFRYSEISQNYWQVYLLMWPFGGCITPFGRYPEGIVGFSCHFSSKFKFNKTFLFTVVQNFFCALSQTHRILMRWSMCTVWIVVHHLVAQLVNISLMQINVIIVNFDSNKSNITAQTRSNYTLVPYQSNGAKL